MSSGRPRMCISTTATPRAASSGTHHRVVVQPADVVDDGHAFVEGEVRDLAPWWCRSTAGPANRQPMARSTGRSRASSSSTLTGAAPGRVDSAPMSMMSAPAASIACTASMARAGSEARPSAENESVVRLSTPITSVRGPSSERAAGREDGRCERVGRRQRARSFLVSGLRHRRRGRARARSFSRARSRRPSTDGGGGALGVATRPAAGRRPGGGPDRRPAPRARAGRRQWPPDAASARRGRAVARS